LFCAGIAIVDGIEGAGGEKLGLDILDLVGVLGVNQQQLRRWRTKETRITSGACCMIRTNS
jgi:hypothetical protein